MYGKGLAGSDVFKPLRAHDYQTQGGTFGGGTEAAKGFDGVTRIMIPPAPPAKGRFMFGCPECGATSSHTPSCFHASVPPIRTFDSGATRDTAEGKLEIAGFLHPLVVERFCEYMNDNRKMKDGSVRASDNWQSGFPEEVLMQSSWRHFLDFWKEHKGIATSAGLEVALCAILFNVQAYLLQVLKKREYKGGGK